MSARGDLAVKVLTKPAVFSSGNRMRGLDTLREAETFLYNQWMKSFLRLFFLFCGCPHIFTIPVEATRHRTWQEPRGGLPGCSGPFLFSLESLPLATRPPLLAYTPSDELLNLFSFPELSSVSKTVLCSYKWIARKEGAELGRGAVCCVSSWLLT